MVTGRRRHMCNAMDRNNWNEDGGSAPESSGEQGDDDGGGRAPAAAVRPLSLSRGVPRERPADRCLTWMALTWTCPRARSATLRSVICLPSRHRACVPKPEVELASLQLSSLNL
ncbi:hypothetical protein GQ55_4G063700 [Panicum hallii var. hallii]|uniref:Uncharacterized protein n=1 Tax=Panicum hallii var. hallii TaxID=1504633 RepID=A0A2T7DVU5_9POAL|nr:hypothetical protein GQ55_4G063700 [Panicum hallii var. hallii]